MEGRCGRLRCSCRRKNQFTGGVGESLTVGWAGVMRMSIVFPEVSASEMMGLRKRLLW